MPFLPTFNDTDDQFDLEPLAGSASRAEGQEGADQRVRIAIRALRQVQQQVENILETLERGEGMTHVEGSYSTDTAPEGGEADRVVEGVFDGERMMGTDGIKYNIPPNYASKSKLVEGDILKLVIKDDGSFIFKQIGPVERTRVVGSLAVDDYGNYACVAEDDTTYRILTASVTYFKGEPGDEVVALVPQGQAASWAAVENIIKKTHSS